MHEVEKRIADWRKGMPRTLSEETIDELESHLRDGVTDLMTRGFGPEEAFERAARELGSMSGLAREFEKTDRGLWLPIKFAIGVGLLGVAAGVVTLRKQPLVLTPPLRRRLAPRLQQIAPQRMSSRSERRYLRSVKTFGTHSILTRKLHLRV